METGRKRERSLLGGPVGRGMQRDPLRQIFTCFFSIAELAAVVRLELHEWFPGADRPYMDGYVAASN